MRFEDHNYSQAGAYFVTVCVKDRECLLGGISNGEMVLNEYGDIVRKCWNNLPNHYLQIELDTFVIMPNHVHGIIILTTNTVGTIHESSAAFASNTVGAVHEQPNKKAMNELSLCEMVSFVETGLAAKRSDVIHDILAFLAEQMIEINKKKIDEIKGFLKWFEREIQADIETLTNKTAIKEYHEHTFEQLLDVLKQNKKKLSVDPSDRNKQELFEKHFIGSIERLNPLKAQIEATDKLIDQIVYKLYGLTEDEIKIAENR